MLTKGREAGPPIAAAQGASVCAEKRIHRLQEPYRKPDKRRRRIAGDEEANGAQTAHLGILMKPVGKMALVKVGNGRSRTIPGRGTLVDHGSAREVAGASVAGAPLPTARGGRFRGSSAFDDGDESH